MPLLLYRIARIGVPENITSDGGRQLISVLWVECNKLLDVEIHTTTAYHSHANDMVERFHCQLKAALTVHTTTADWLSEIPLGLLGIRSSGWVDHGCSPAGLVYSSTLRLSGEFLQQLDTHTIEPDSMFVRLLQQAMRTSLPPAPKFHGKQSVYVPSNLASAGFVCVRHHANFHPLQRPYDGRRHIIDTNDKFYILDINGRLAKVSVDRVKAPFVTPLTTSERKTVISPGTDVSPTSPKATSSARRQSRFR